MCKHCFVNRKLTTLSENKVLDIIDELDRHGLMYVTFTYGEPLLADDYYSVSRYLKDKHIVRVLMTNGTLVNEENYEKVGNSSEIIYVSIDHSNAHKHDENRGINGSFSKAVKSIKLLKRVNANVGIATTVTDNNVDSIDRIYSLAKELEVRSISFLRERRDGLIYKFNNERMYCDQIMNIIKSKDDPDPKLIIHDAKLNKSLKKLLDNHFIDYDQYLASIDENRCMSCTTLSLEPNGDVRRCNISGKILGNVYRNSIEEILEVNYENFSCIPTLSR